MAIALEAVSVSLYQCHLLRPDFLGSKCIHIPGGVASDALRKAMRISSRSIVSSIALSIHQILEPFQSIIQDCEYLASFSA